MKGGMWLVDEHLADYLRTSLVIRWNRDEAEFIEVLDAELAYLRRELLLARQKQMEDGE